jgi:myosin-5
VDNQDVLDLIEGKMGILDLLDEQCRFEGPHFTQGL